MSSYRPILTNAERQRNARLKELLANRTKVHQNQEKGVNQETKPMYLTPAQFEKMKDLQKEGLSREDAVDWVLENIK